MALGMVMSVSRFWAILIKTPRAQRRPKQKVVDVGCSLAVHIKSTLLYGGSPSPLVSFNHMKLFIAA